MLSTLPEDTVADTRLQFTSGAAGNGLSAACSSTSRV